MARSEGLEPPAFRSVDARTGVRDCSDQSVTWGSPPPVVQGSSEHPKGVHPRGSQSGSQIPLPELAPPVVGGLPGDAAQDPPDECPVLVILDLPPRPLWCQPSLDTGSPGVLVGIGWIARHHGGHLPAPSASAVTEVIGLGPSPDRCRVVEPGVEVKLRLLDALD